MANALCIFVPVAIRALVDRLAPRLEAAAGQPLVPLVDLNPAIPRRIAAGETFDLGLTNPPYVAALISSGRVDGDSHRPFGRVPLAVARRAGTDAPVLTDSAEISALLRGARGIAYTGAGTSGRTYLETLARLGLADALARNSRPMAAGEPVAAVAAGEVALAVAPLTTILSSEGVVPAAIFPADLDAHIDMSIFLGAAPGPGAAAVLEVLTAPALDAELAAAGVMRFAFG